MKGDTLVGIHAVEEWLDAEPPRISALLVGPGANDRVRRLIDRARERGISVRAIARADLERLAGQRNSQGVAAEVRPFPYAQLEACSGDTVLIVDGVTDPQNFGAILRSAAFFKVGAVVVPMDRSAPVSPVVERTAAGAAARVPIVQAPSLVAAVESLKARGYRIVASIVGGHTHLAEADLSGPVALVVGSEGQGIRPSIRRLADQRVALPSDGLESLNVASFTSVLLYAAAAANHRPSVGGSAVRPRAGPGFVGGSADEFEED